MPRGKDAGCNKRKDCWKRAGKYFRAEPADPLMSKAWPERPKGLSERSYRKYMARQKKVTVNGMEFTLQSVSPRWYFDLNDRCGMTGGRRKTAEYMDELFKNVVVEPKEVSTNGLDYFEETEDIKTAGKLLTEVEHFLG